MSAPGLSISGLHVAYERDIEILRGIDLAAAPRQITAVIGPNGAGKSTLLKAVAGLAPVTAGTIRLADRPVTGLPARSLLALGLAFVPQEGTVFRDMTVAENLVMGAWLRRGEKGWVAERVAAVAALFGMDGAYLQRRAGDLSGGQQKLLEIARSLVLMPAMLLLDEPTAGLSPKMAGQVYRQLARLPEEHDITVLLVDQNVRAALEIADHVYVVALGRNDASGPADDIAGRLDAIIAGWMKEAASGVARA